MGLAKWTKENETPAAEAEEIKLTCQLPPIDKMDTSLLTLANCSYLSLCSNAINKIKNLNGLNAVGDTLEQLWISNNNIEKLKGVHVLKKLSVLFMANNVVKDWGEFNKLADLPGLVDLVFVGNPLQVKHTEEGDWMERVGKSLPNLKKLDGNAVIREES